MSEFISYLFMLLVVAPLQSAITDNLKEAGAQAEVIQVGQACLNAAVPQLVKQAQGDYVWAASTAAGVMFGYIPPTNLLTGKSPECDRLVSLLGDKGGSGEKIESQSAPEASDV
ncbi:MULTISPECIES: hypothetical protein [Rhizobium]|uniref:Uncharacterized protein n=1 Tax=Rhizobium metallidurans TaxID=1265931 RepID=A0A7W6GAW1_9HYPH|nr:MULTISPECIES: hypothetical protein [Rhizobium]MBB3963041.1 hypothetical protein [Rhizobium metallidurans]